MRYINFLEGETMSKDQNLLLVTEHYPCGAQESYLETEIEYLTRY